MTPQPVSARPRPWSTSAMGSCSKLLKQESIEPPTPTSWKVQVDIQPATHCPLNGPVTPSSSCKPQRPRAIPLRCPGLSQIYEKGLIVPADQQRALTYVVAALDYSPGATSVENAAIRRRSVGLTPDQVQLAVNQGK